MADTATITIAHRDAPFDPRAIRSASVEITLGTVSADDFARGARGERRDDGSLYSVVPRVPAGSPPAPGTTRFIGFVDDWSVDRGDGDVVELQCRDLSSLLFDQKMPASLGIDQTLPIDEAIRGLLNEFPSMRGTNVEWTGEDEAPTLSSALTRARTARRGGTSRRARSGGESFVGVDDDAFGKGTAIHRLDHRGPIGPRQRGRFRGRCRTQNRTPGRTGWAGATGPDQRDKHRIPHRQISHAVAQMGHTARGLMTVNGGQIPAPAAIGKGDIGMADRHGIQFDLDLSRTGGS